MKRLSYIIILLVGTVGLFDWMSRSFSTTWEPKLRATIENAASRATQKQVHIDSIAPNIFRGVRLVNIRVTHPEHPDPPEFEAGRIELSISFLGLPQAIAKRQFSYVIGGVHIHEPRARLSSRTFSRSHADSKSSSFLPPLFTLSWKGGILQWEDARAPKGQWTLYQAEGAYRIRGPQASMSVRGQMDGVRNIAFQGSRFGKRWNATLTAKGGDAQKTLTLFRSLTKQSILPPSWELDGLYALEVDAGGRRIPSPSAPWWEFIDKASVRFHEAENVPQASTGTVRLYGTLLFKNNQITANDFRFHIPWITGKGNIRASWDPTIKRSKLFLEADISEGHLGQWKYQDAKLRMVREGSKWEITESPFQFLNGRVVVKGTLSRTGPDLSFTAENLSLAHLVPEGRVRYLTGLLNASCTLKGAPESWQLTGAWWLNEAAWGKLPLGSAKGDLSFTSREFQVQGKSDQSRFRLSFAGRRTPEYIDFDHVELYLPSGSSISSVGRYHLLRKTCHLSWNASQLQLSNEIPFLQLGQIPLEGRLSAQGQWQNTLEDPLIKATLRSDDLTYAQTPIGISTAHFQLLKKKIYFPTFHLGSGIEGRYADGEGTVRIQNARLGKWSFTKGGSLFFVRPKAFEIKEFFLSTPKAELRGGMKMRWETLHSTQTLTQVEGQGEVRPIPLEPLGTIPFSFSGQLMSGADVRNGKIDVTARLLGGNLVGKYVLTGTRENRNDAFTGKLSDAKWKAFLFSTDIAAAWSIDGLKPLTLKGIFKTGGDFEFTGQLSPETRAQGTLKLRQVNIKPLGESLNFPKSLQGFSQATLTLYGPLDRLTWTGHIDGGPIIYAAESERPFKLELLSMDMTLAPQEGAPGTTRLTITEGQAKTVEELIRFHPRSYIDFTGANPAPFMLGTDLRNVHWGLFTLFGGLKMDGTWQIKPEGFAIQAKAQSDSLFINNYELQEGALLGDYYNGILKFSAAPGAPRLVTGTVDFRGAPQLKFTDFYITGIHEQRLLLSGDIGPALWNYRMEGKGLDVSALGELAGFPYPLSGTADVQLNGKGNANQPQIEGRVELERGSILGLAFQSGKAAFNWQNDRISFDRLLLNDPGRYTLEGSGDFPLRRKESKQTLQASLRTPINFAIRLKDSNLSMLKSLSPEIKEAGGPVDGELTIKGTLDEPLLAGSLRISRGEVLGAHYFRHLRSGHLQLNFVGDTIHIKELHAKSGEGEFQGTGKITLSGFAPALYDLGIQVTSKKGVEIQVPDLAIPDSPLAKRFKFLTTESRGLVNGQVSLRGPADSPTFSGEVLISNGHFTFPPSQKRPPSPGVLEWFRRIYWDVTLRFQEGAWFDNELVQAKVLGALTLKGQSDQLAVDGGIDIQEGVISYLGLQFDIRQARYDIRSEKSDNRIINRPYVRGIAESEAQAVDTVSGVAGGGSRLSINDTITLNIDYAPIDQIKPRLTSASNPTLSQEKILARVTQTDLENLNQQERNYLYQKQLVSLIDSSLTTPLARNVLKKTGIADSFRVEHVFDPSAVATDLNPVTAQQQSQSVSLLANTKYTIGKDINSRLSVGYGLRFLPSADVDPELQERKLDLVSDVQLSYRWFRNVFLRGTFDLPNSTAGFIPDRRVTIEPRWRFGWWGNTNKKKKE
jgi:hypothetical protein